MAYSFSLGVRILFCILILNVFNAYAQLFPNEIETAHAKVISKVVESEEAGESSRETTINTMNEQSTTETTINTMNEQSTTESKIKSFRDVTSGPTPEVCTPAMNCAFQPVDPFTGILTGEIIYFCPRCTEGYECRFFQEDLTQETNVYSCQKVKEVTETDSSTTEMTPSETTVNSEIRHRIGSMVDIHEL